jgi:antitoxin component of MazEF toxin-antitoxin module
VRTDGDSIVVTLPPSAIEDSRIEEGGQVKVATVEGNIMLLPWELDDIAEYADR